jgi:hypothetical protein
MALVNCSSPVTPGTSSTRQPLARLSTARRCSVRRSSSCSRTRVAALVADSSFTSAKSGGRRALNHRAVADRINGDKEFFRRQGCGRQSDYQEARDDPFFHLSISLQSRNAPACHGYGLSAEEGQGSSTEICTVVDKLSRGAPLKRLSPLKSARDGSLSKFRFWH